MRRRLKPKNDFIFARLFGEQETKDNLIALLNAILRLEGNAKIVDLTVIDNKQLEKEFIDDKTGRLDVRAETYSGEQIDIEMQLTNQHNMTKRSLFYLSKLYVDSIKAGGKYGDLKRTIAINILDFNILPIARYHSTFHFYEDHEEDFMLTDVMEIHYIEYPKFRGVEKNLHDPLHRWLLFLDEKLPEDQLEELMAMDPVIRQAEARLEWLSGDEETLRLYEAREHARIEHNSLMWEAEQRGIRKVALNLIDQGLDNEFISKMTGLSLAEVNRIRQTEPS